VEVVEREDFLWEFMVLLVYHDGQCVSRINL
jgi:hypothetical protein